MGEQAKAVYTLAVIVNDETTIVLTFTGKNTAIAVKEQLSMYDTRLRLVKEIN